MTIKNNIKGIITIHDGDDIRLFGDKSELTQALVNVLENAFHATQNHPNPRIDVRIKNQAIIIEDNGIGISPTDLPSIFDEFFSTKSSSGQGLAFCKNVINEHGGSIYCTSQKGEFTRFDLRFPPLKIEIANV